MKRVVITGMGVISPIGNNVDEFWDNIVESKVGIKPITRFDTENYKVKVAAEVKEFDPKLTMDRKEYSRMDLFSQYGVAAAVEALNMSGYEINEENADKVGTLVSSGIGGLPEIEKGVLKIENKGPHRIPPLFVPMIIGNMASGNISIKTGAKGISLDIVTACASSTNAIGEAFLKIATGQLDACFAGGAEATICPIGIAGFASLTALSESEDSLAASIPFDKRRDGFVMGEGSGILFLESLESAEARGANILGEIVGYGSTTDANHMTAPCEDGSGAGKAMIKAMDMAGIKADQVDYINAHGTSTPTNDKFETRAIKYALGENYAKNVAISSSKSQFGHLLGAAGGIEAIVCIMALKESIIPATVGLSEVDPECDLDYVPNKCRNQSMTYALSNSLGFGGHNAVLCFKKWG